MNTFFYLCKNRIRIIHAPIVPSALATWTCFGFYFPTLFLPSSSFSFWKSKPNPNFISKPQYTWFRIPYVLHLALGFGAWRLAMEDLSEMEIGSSVESFQKFLDSQRQLFHSQIDQLQKVVVTQCNLTGVNPLSQEMVRFKIWISFCVWFPRIRRIIPAVDLSFSLSNWEETSSMCKKLF